MSLVTTVANFLTSGTIKTIADTVKDYFPPSMSDQEKTELTLKIKEAEHNRDLETIKMANEETEVFNQRIRDLEGTAEDLKSIPILGQIMIFLRGAQRPVWGFGALYMDYMVLSGTWNITSEPRIQAIMLAINLLVLGFLFGERAIKNVAPLLKEFFGKK